jgi:exodeoxyribonuclease VII large subunit
MLRLDRERNRLDRLSGRLIGHLPARPIGEAQMRCRMLDQAMTEVLGRELAARRSRLERAAGVLQALNPQTILTRGYTITMDSDGRPLTSAKEVEAGMPLRTRFHDGEVESVAAKR